MLRFSVISGTVLGCGSPAPTTPAPPTMAFFFGDVLANASLWYQVNSAHEPDQMWLLEESGLGNLLISSSSTAQRI